MDNINVVEVKISFGGVPYVAILCCRTFPLVSETYYRVLEYIFPDTSGFRVRPLHKDN